MISIGVVFFDVYEEGSQNIGIPSSLAVKIDRGKTPKP